MFRVDNYTPTRVVFGAGRLEELATMELPGKKSNDFCDCRWPYGEAWYSEKSIRSLEEE